MYPDFFSGRTTYFRPGGETRTRARAPISANRSPFFSGGHNYPYSTSATRLSSESHSARSDAPVSASVTISASQIPLSPLERSHDYSNNDTGDFEPIRGQSRYSRNVQRSSSSEEFSDRSGRRSIKRNTNRRLFFRRIHDETTALSSPLDPGTTATSNRDSRQLKSVSRRSMLLSIFRRNKTGRNESWTGATGRDKTESQSRASRSRLSCWKASRSRSHKTSAITTRLFRLRKHIKSGWNHKRHPTSEDQTTESSLEFIPDFDDRP